MATLIMTKEQEDFAELVAAYLRESARKMSELWTYWQKLKADPDSSETLRQFKMAAHRIKGSGGSYGFPLVSTLAEQIESVLSQMLEESTAASPGDLQQLFTWLTKLEGEFRAAISQFKNHPRTSMRVAVVDDDPDLLELIERKLDQAGFQVCTLPYALRTLQMLREFMPDVLILDIEMPEMNGLEVCKIVRKTAPFKTLPILILTSRTDEATGAAGLRAGADDYLTKPVRSEELIAHILERIRQQP